MDNGSRIVIYVLAALLLLVVLCNIRSCHADGEPAWGVFVDRRWPEIAHLRWETICFELQKYGMNSAVIYAYGVQDLAEQMDIATCTGLFKKEVPVFVCFNASPPGMGDPPFGMFKAAREVGTLTKHWPEMIAYGMDESPTVNEGHKTMYDQAHAAGCRLGAGVIYPMVAAQVQFLDVLLVSVLVGGELEANRRAILAYPREYGNYYVCHVIKTTDHYDLMRYYAGIWTWQTGAKYCYIWDYRRLLGMDERWPGDRAAQGLRDGVRDWHRLNSLDWDFATSLKEWIK